MNFISESDRYIFGQGRHYEIYKKLGAHLSIKNEEGNIFPDKKDENIKKCIKGVYFSVWAPHAKEVSVVGEFNEWQVGKDRMTPIETSGIWEVFVEGVKEWDMYKFAIKTKNDEVILKSDPYALHTELRPGTASKVVNISDYEWNDEKWYKKGSKKRTKEGIMSSPMSIYEVHLGSWKKDTTYNEDGFIDYKTLAKELCEYIVEMGYTHIELMGIAEHPFDGSWGYQVTGYYAPTARYGAPKDFMYFVDYMHQHGIGVILDWVPAHFPKDAFALSMFDGEPLYEYADTRKGEHPDWGTKVFDYSKNEVSNFLIANALFWVKEYHIDALRVDAVASMLYLDYGRKSGEWVKNIYGDNKNLEAIEFFKHLNSIMDKRIPHALLIAEESTAWPMVTRRPEDGGLGFDLKWNMGWMNDFLEYLKIDPFFKKGAHNKLTFSLTYAFSENYILVISHDEVVHLKCSMLKKMPGYPADKFANLKTAYTFMFGHPGKKLTFMGQEFAQLEEWSEKRSLDWYLLNEPMHKNMQTYFSNLLKLYKEYPVLYKYEHDARSFEWINANDRDRSIYSFIRKKPESYAGALIFICNFTPMDREDYKVGVYAAGNYKIVQRSSSNNEEVEKEEVYKAQKSECDNRNYSLSIHLHPFEAIVLKKTR